ncbi:hypothetical protein HAP47_0009855 [Bradyrhizobium sp. 41S5]|uniref:hypothetical protein n=1 Tax=Bradyrhizobium sp. 41S5 TaxID=1404443 RepID=UPI00156BA747|nr:hypothetical protein [Bradyrhizobium sp. 41S5]UFX46940.1 hypothetical protein HAP47_0009855 [Bradyrhizobium sp. 41S5]
MVCSPKLCTLAGLLIVSAVATGARAEAFDLNGAWVGDADQCDKVFNRKGGKRGFTEMSDVYGGGFIIDGDEIIGKFARCKIKAKKEDGSSINLIAGCATDIMLSSVQFSVKKLDANSIIRLFPGMDGMEITYHRCPNP